MSSPRSRDNSNRGRCARQVSTCVLDALDISGLVGVACRSCGCHGALGTRPAPCGLTQAAPGMATEKPWRGHGQDGEAEEMAVM